MSIRSGSPASPGNRDRGAILPAMSREPTPDRVPDDPVIAAAYRAFVRRAEADPNVLGLVLFGPGDSMPS